MKKHATLILPLIIALLALSNTYTAWRIHIQNIKVEARLNENQNTILALQEELTLNTETLTSNINDTKTTLVASIERERNALQNELGSFEQKVGTISGTVNNLEKLTKTDPELLQKYSKVFFLNEHYEPPRLTEVPDIYEYDESRHHKVHASVWPFLQNMLSAGKNAGKELYIYSAYRSFEEQRALKGIYSITYGEGTANQFSADQGYSEHQLGTTIDLITTGISGTLDGFDATDDFVWLKNNAYRYGFVLSYPEGNADYVFEPWHWRFVGVPLATYLYNNRLTFYEMSQRDIDEYLVNIFD